MKFKKFFTRKIKIYMVVLNTTEKPTEDSIDIGQALFSTSEKPFYCETLYITSSKAQRNISNIVEKLFYKKYSNEYDNWLYFRNRSLKDKDAMFGSELWTDFALSHKEEIRNFCAKINVITVRMNSASLAALFRKFAEIPSLDASDDEFAFSTDINTDGSNN